MSFSGVLIRHNQSPRLCLPLPDADQPTIRHLCKPRLKKYNGLQRTEKGPFPRLNHMRGLVDDKNSLEIHFAQIRHSHAPEVGMIILDQTIYRVSIL